MGVIAKLPASYIPIQVVVGPGSVSPKSAGVINKREAIICSGFHKPDMISITPKFFDRFFWDSGALSAPNLEKAQESIYSGVFLPEERQIIMDAVLSLHPLLRCRLMVRSDNYARGMGVQKSEILYIRMRREGITSSKFLEDFWWELQNRMKTVLASDFTSNAQEFKRIKDIGESGILIMPLYGETTYDASGKPLYLAPPLSINFLGPSRGRYIFSIGSGFGGQNKKASIYLNTGKELIPENMYFSRRCCTYVNVVICERGTVHMREFLEFFSPNSFFEREGSMYPISSANLNPASVNAPLSNLIRAIGSCYVEIVSDSMGESPCWVVVQLSDLAIPKTVSPLPAKSAIARTSLVSGSGLVETEGTFVTKEPDDKIREFNRTHNNYLLIIDASEANNLTNWPINCFSNAGAILLRVRTMDNPFGSHIGGLFRELGIPVLAFKSEAILSEVPPDPLVQVDLSEGARHIVYADEFRKRGLVFRLA
ncbi:MAG: hypothetical protein PHS02_04290 [Candidatus ainarchaeum sp.]|nr:hypothetical protein [Candidatus ainarchaeum sp.]